MAPVRILYAIPNFITAGSGRALWYVATRLDRSRFEPHVVVERRGGKIEAELESAGIPVYEMPFTVKARPRRTLLWRAWQAAAPFRPFRFDLWHSYHYGSDYTEGLIARMAGARWLYTKKNMSWGDRGWYLRTALASAVPSQNSTMLRDFFARPWMQRRARLVESSVDVGKFTPGLPPRLGLRRQLGVGQGQLLVACVANLIPLKGIEPLVRAVARVPDLHLVVAGPHVDSEHGQHLEGVRRELGVEARVHFLGPVSDVPGLLAESDLFALTSEREGAPVALLEAMAAGLPSVVTRIAGTQDILREGESGLFVPVGDVGAMAGALARLAGDPGLRARLGVAARRRAESHYSIDREVAQLVGIYEEMLTRRF
jgi:glycosyltransferase involved in cell wall biosynthesis